MYEIGDTVIVRDWDDLVSEYGLKSNGFIGGDTYMITPMRKFCGKVFHVSYVDTGSRYVELAEDHLQLHFGFSAIAPYKEPSLPDVDIDRLVLL